MQNKFNFEQFLRTTFKDPLDKVAFCLNKKGVTANMVTVAGLAGTIFAAWLTSQGRLFLGGLVLVLMAPLDAVDGSLARMSGRVSRFGAFLDSFTDRYEELFMLGALVYYFSQRADLQGVMFSFAAAAGSVMVSYARARAEGLSIPCKVGLLTRIERTVIMVLGLLFHIPGIAVGIIAVLANFTAWQRFFYVREADLNQNK